MKKFRNERSHIYNFILNLRRTFVIPIDFGSRFKYRSEMIILDPLWQKVPDLTGSISTTML
jgi:hypothetical protein